MPAGSAAVAADEDPLDDDAPDPAAVVPVLEEVLAVVWLVEPDELDELEAAGVVGVEPVDELEWCELGL